MKNFRWTTRDGKSLLLAEMSTEHLKNTVRYLRRAAKENENAYWSVGAMLSGDAATYSWEGAQDAVLELTNYNNSVADLMEDEVRLRETNVR